MPAPLIHTDIGSLSQLRTLQRSDSDAALLATARQFEALLTQQMLSAMRATSFGEDGSGKHGDTYKQLLDGQLAQTLASGKGLGIAEQLVAQLRGTTAKAATATADSRDMSLPQQRITARRAPPGATPAVLQSESAASVAAPAAKGVTDQVRHFVDRVMPHARRAAEALGIPVRAVLAHAALESGWGRHAPGDNFFGIKADARWNGARDARATQEFEDGAMRGQLANFRSYSGAAQAFDDYAAFLQSNPRYAAALQRRGDGPGFLQAVARAGYATDPDYASKLERVYHSPLLDRALDAVPRGGSRPDSATTEMHL